MNSLQPIEGRHQKSNDVPFSVFSLECQARAQGIGPAMSPGSRPQAGRMSAASRQSEQLEEFIPSSPLRPASVTTICLVDFLKSQIVEEVATASDFT
jgi:hypothetical protein